MLIIFLIIFLILLNYYFVNKISIKILSWILLFFILITLSFKSVNNWPWYNNKYTIYSHIPNKYRLNSYLFDNQIDNLITNNKLSYPFVVKPVICSGLNRNVHLISNEYELNQFIKKKDKNEKYMIQEFYPSKYEIGLLFEKVPFINEGKIVSIVLKERDGTKKWKPLKCANLLGSGVNCLIRTDLITGELEQVIRRISKNIPGFNMGRFDIGFDDLNEFKKGRGFKCFELNGVMGFDLEFSSQNYKIRENLLIGRWILMRFLVGFINLISGNTSVLNNLISYTDSYEDWNRCKDWERWFEPCPA